ncbi:MAG: cation:proton antiporter [Bacteroidales bacterium]|nr:cation:proton antiporter [Bacteroidales bacterium]
MIITNSIFPLHEPLLIFTLLIGIIFLSPFVFRIIRVPDVASFIIMGIIAGPYGFNILKRDASIELLGTVGLLYIMFMAGLELNTEKFKLTRKNSIIFGFLTFIIPAAIGFLVSKHFLILEFHAIILVSIMFSTHTLIAYPIARKAGVTRDISVLTAVGGTIITDTLVLTILSLITHDYQDVRITNILVRLFLSFTIYIVLIFYTYPKTAGWFFKHVKRDRPVHYLFILFLVCLSALLAKLIGLEPIIGAFVAGLALNKSIPKNSLLMHHIDLVGNVLFVPVFLIGAGMLININVVFSGTYFWLVSSVLIATAFAGKWLAAYISQKILHFTTIQRNLLFGLTSSHAAATIAIILIGYERQMLDISVFNATIIVILVSCLAASFITEKYSKKLALSMDFLKAEKHSGNILVPIANPGTMANLVSIANSFQTLQYLEPVYVLHIENNERSTKESLIKIREVLERNVADFNNLSENIKVITRIDLNVASGILRAAKEYMASDIVIGWNNKTSASQRIFGSIFDNMLSGQQTVYGVNISTEIDKIEKINLHLPRNIDHEPSFNTIIDRIIRLPVKSDSEIVFIAENENCLEHIRSLLPKKHKKGFTFNYSSCSISEKDLSKIDVYFIMRKRSVAYNARYNNSMKAKLMAFKSDFIVIVPGYE